MSQPVRMLSRYTLWVLVFYVPIETWASWPELYSPYYIVDFIAMVLLTAGVVRSRQGQALSALGFLAGGGVAWCQRLARDGRSFRGDC